MDHLTRRVNELQEQIALYEAQHMAQAEDTRITRQDVGEVTGCAISLRGEEFFMEG